MYILAEFKNIYGSKVTTAYENISQLKKDVVKILDNRGWDNKDEVKLNNILSCIKYIYSDCHDYKISRTKSWKKYNEYKF